MAADNFLGACYRKAMTPKKLWTFPQRGLFRKVHFLEILENLEILEILENPQTVENKGESDHFLEILENLEILEILEIPPVKRPISRLLLLKRRRRHLAQSVSAHSAN